MRCLRAVSTLLILAAPLAWADRATAADAGTCGQLEARFNERRQQLEVPQISAALFSAADNGCEALARTVLDFGASVAARDREGGTALTHAARGGDEAMIRLLVAHGAEIDERTVTGSTPLYVAVESDRGRAVQALVELGAGVNIAGRGGVTPLSAAAYNGRLKLVDLLLSHGADATLRDGTGKVPILYAAARGFGSVIERLLKTGIDVNATYGNDLTVLMWAAGYANDVPADDGIALVTALLDKGAHIDAVDDRGRTSLMTAAELGHDEIVDLLLARGAKADLRDKSGKAAADLAGSEAVRKRLAAR